MTASLSQVYGVAWCIVMHDSFAFQIHYAADKAKKLKLRLNDFQSNTILKTELIYNPVP